MKITQNPDNGQVLISLEANEKYNTEDHLSALTEFLTEQAQIIFDLKHSYHKILERSAEINRLYDKLNELIKGERR